jgi:hypothetical protein
MKIFFSRFSQLATGALSALLLGAAIHPLSATGQSCELDFSSIAALGDGIQPSVAAHHSGLVVSVFTSRNSLGPLVYRVGKLNGLEITWGNNFYTGLNGYRPAVVISKAGDVLIVYSDRDYKAGAFLLYRVGSLDPAGDEKQEITWRTSIKFWDYGYNAGIAVNNAGAIVGVHESGHDGGDGIYYRVGRFLNPAGDDFTIFWETGEWGIKYDTGVNPRIAVNDNDRVVSVHQVPGESLLHYRTGTLEQLAGVAIDIDFLDSRRYDDSGLAPSIALLDNGRVLEVHKSGNGDLNLMSRTGQLNLSNASEIVWDLMIRSPIRADNSPAIATNGTVAIETHMAVSADENGPAGPYIAYSVVPVCD